MSGAGFQHHREPLGSDARIDHRDEYRAIGPELFGLVQTVGAGENAGIFVAQVGNQQILRDAVGHSLHGRHGAILRAEIGEEHQRAARRHGSRQQRQSHSKQGLPREPEHQVGAAAAVTSFGHPRDRCGPAQPPERGAVSSGIGQARPPAAPASRAPKSASLLPGAQESAARSAAVTAPGWT